MHAVSQNVEQAYRECLRQAHGHYENFPVASRLLPAHLRRPVAAIYSFARRGDDLADEGERPAEDRLRALDHLAKQLDAAAAGEPDEDPTFIALAHAIRSFNLPVGLFHDLLTAFRQDVTTRRYATFGDVIQYCRCSANPVGRLLLHLSDQADPRRLALSDAVCTSLQLINFYQDLAQDYHEMGRIYIPTEEMQAFGVTEAHFRDRITDAPFRQLMSKQFQRADQLLRSGAPLGAMLPGRVGLEIRLIIVAGARVVWHLKRQQEDLFSRPRLGSRDYLVILRDGLLPGRLPV
ncbi:phytoene synthase [Ectothiorhodospira haloalkaliphila]|uniref:Phytoene synthase n=1 Tax=Ectothiorhodospira haloalkaliphila TaxID=421628 RepID=W8KI64_9GAMM|nr:MULTISPECIES: squalene synthase HpnC [Ectothiorhodospira]AHK79494.1 phytoene synthase [Ectothiorhodospira haloalkaliphila]MCG5495136.1 squalene synthase HpnC [Ectothiorhodospira variabilis]MCG5503830.1 squalene synthase HpnC [Ectothiorhodospira variabilis]MCG5507039.1 squalene synthase HpnC [Ectothiorhodospira variabilis]MCG5525559.1 squalene synthase HpnC [Ectothiorhodospira haloalkaliphila]